MIIYKDLFSEDAEVLTDSYPCELIFECLYKVKGKLKSETYGIDDSLIGGNASAEGGPEDGGAEAASITNIDVVIANQLAEVTDQFKKKEYKGYLKKFSSNVVKKLEGSPRQEIFKKNAGEAAKFLIGIFDDAQIFVGEKLNASNILDEDPPCSVVMVQTESDGSIFLYYWKDGLKEEKA